jgi:hypothetical protein
MYIALAPFKLKEGMDEQTLLEASDKFEKEFVHKQKGIIKRILMKNIDGSYADMVFTAGRTPAMTTRSPSLNSRRSSTAPMVPSRLLCKLAFSVSRF